MALGDQMVKVAVGRSIAHAYTFLFGRFFQIIGTAWLPALLYGLGSYFVLSNMARWFPAHAQDTATVISTLGAALGVAAVVM
ncbi:MAG: hypothetical protein JO348_08625, partial [Alphaproteobacteria bacterium]|nr:hypothetical protein [Alphaproteobacteria bacterium]